MPGLKGNIQEWLRGVQQGGDPSTLFGELFGEQQTGFDNLPGFDLPPPPDFFNNGFEFDPANPTFGAFTGFEPTGGIEEAIMSLIRQKAERDTISGIIPDRADWEASLAAQIDEIKAGILGSREQFAAATSARGITGSGETPRQLFRDVLAPGVRAATTVAAGATLDFAKFTSQATVAQEQLLQGDRAQLLDAGKTNAQIASVEAQFGANLESTERMEANRNALQKSIHDDNISLDVYKSQLQAQLAEYLSQMTWLTATDVANIQGWWALQAGKAQNKNSLWSAFGQMMAAWAAAGFPVPSDARLKENIAIAQPGLAEIAKLEPKTFTWKSTGEKDFGLIAQEVQEVIPVAVDKMPDGEHLGIRPMALIGLLVNSVKELKAEIDELKAGR